MVPPAVGMYRVAKMHEDVQAVPNMESDSTVKQTTDSLFSECVLDFSKYLSSTDLPAAPGEFFDDLLFQRKVSKNPALQRHLPGLIKIKEEPDSTTTSRCSTPESMLPEHDFDNGEFPTPKFQRAISRPEKGITLMSQLQSIPHSNVTTDVDDSDDDDSFSNDNDLDAESLKEALVQLEQTHSEGGMISPRKFQLKSPRCNKNRKVMSKGSDEYMVKRERNNVAVRKSRTKAKLKHIETQMRVGELTEENDQLRSRISTIQKELDALKSFFAFNSQNGKSYYSNSYADMYTSTKLV